MSFYRRAVGPLVTAHPDPLACAGGWFPVTVGLRVLVGAGPGLALAVDAGPFLLPRSPFHGRHVCLLCVEDQVVPRLLSLPETYSTRGKGCKLRAAKG